MAEELRAMGATVFELDVRGFVFSNREYVKTVIEQIRSFHPDVAMALPNALYALLCRSAQGHNIFRDILQIPVIMLWDHGLLQLPKWCLGPLPDTPSQSTAGSIQKLREALNHPLYHHYSPDSGYVMAFDRLGILSRDKVKVFLQPAYPNFVKYGYRIVDRSAFRTRVAFAGNVYLQASRELPFRDEPVLAEIEERVIARKQARLTDSLWDLLMAEIDRLDRPTREWLKLVPDSTFFWGFVHDEIEMVGNTRVRLAVLAGLKREYDFFGNFVEPKSADTLRSHYNIRLRKSLDYFTELPLLFINSDVIVDVINLGYNSGISPKVMGCLACGGLILFDYKEDFHRALGDVGNQVMYRSIDELNSLVDLYLSDGRQQRDVSRYLQYQISTQYSFRSLCQRILAEEPVWRNVG
jgi:spore maturation protein CgeB